MGGKLTKLSGERVDYSSSPSKGDGGGGGDDDDKERKSDVRVNGILASLNNYDYYLNIFKRDSSR